jgi:RHS repeat-associated protein
MDPDHLNTPRLVADATGTTVWRWDQAEPFGNNPADEDPDANSVAFDLPLRLPGQRYDAESGLHYNYFRDYDPSLGRYGESDHLGLFAGPNTYAYVGGSPLDRIDPQGAYYIQVIQVCLRIAGAVGGLFGAKKLGEKVKEGFEQSQRAGDAVNACATDTSAEKCGEAAAA